MNIEKLKEIAKQAGSQNGCRVYDFYRHRDRLQFFIDKPKDEVSLKDCENVFHSLKFLIRTEFPEVLDQKRLEVSTPGIEKRLREVWHFEESIGKTIKVITNSPVVSCDERSQKNIRSQSVTAKLEAILPDEICLKETYREWTIPFSKIKTAHVVFLLPKKNKSVKKSVKFNSKVSQTKKRKKRGKSDDFRSTI